MNITELEREVATLIEQRDYIWAERKKVKRELFMADKQVSELCKTRTDIAELLGGLSDQSTGKEIVRAIFDMRSALQDLVELKNMKDENINKYTDNKGRKISAWAQARKVLKGIMEKKWIPTVDNIDVLPIDIREYIYKLEKVIDPEGRIPRKLYIET